MHDFEKPKIKILVETDILAEAMINVMLFTQL